MEPLRPRLRIATILRFTAICGLFLAIHRGSRVPFGPDDDWFGGILCPLAVSVCCALAFMGPWSVSSPCRGCGRRVPARWPAPREPLCRSCRSAKLLPAERRRLATRGFAYIAIFLFVFALTLAWPFEHLVLAPGGWLTGLAALLVVFVALAVLVFAALVARLLVASWRMQRPGHALEVARACAGEPGRIARVGSVSVCWFGACDPVPLLEAQIALTGERFARLVGEPIDAERPLRIFAFDSRASFDAFFRRAFLFHGHSDGVFIPWTPPAIAMTAEFERYRLPDPARIVRLLLGYHWLDGYRRSPASPLWLQIGVGNLVASGGDEDELRRLNRKVRASLARGSALGPAGLFHLNPRTLGPLMRDWQMHANFTRYSQLIAQSWSVTEYLAGVGAPEDRRRRFRDFVRDLAPKRPQEDVFRHQFGRDYEGLLEDWRAWVGAAADGAHSPPPPDLHRLLREELIPLVRDEAAPPLDRIQAVREMGRAGYALGADALIERLGTDRTIPGDELLWSLESISGQVLGPDRRRWEAWLNSLPAAAVGTTPALVPG